MTHPAPPSISQLSQLPEHLWDVDSDQPAAERQFPIRIPSAFSAQINWDNPADPLLMQVLPDAREMSGPGSVDPVGELGARAAGGLVHKYAGRALLVTTSACDIHCRYCFRRHFPYDNKAPDQQRWVEAVDYLATQEEVSEVILSGGDPLTLSNRRLTALTTQLQRLAHLRRLRIHTRTPLVKPQRVDQGLLRWLSELPWPVTIVLHCNHPAELGAAASAAARKLREAGSMLLNQSVLLAGVNNRVEVLSELSQALFERGILPYYLHLLDPVRGASHFNVSEKAAKELVRELRARLPGYLVPRLVCDPPDSPAKQILA